jgi:cell division septation protein DedD
MFREDERMEELHASADDQSHYEISLTAGQAFTAFVLLLLSLSAAFAFGLMLGRGQADERLVVRKETPVVNEASLAPKKNEGRIVELGVPNDDFEAAPTDSAAATVTETTATSQIIEEGQPPAATSTESSAPATQAVVESPAPAAAVSTPAQATAPATHHVTTYAQLLSTSDQKTAETLAARLIDHGFTAAYVERGATDKGPVYRVRVKFDSEADARAAESKLKAYSKEVWITTK